MANQEHLRLLEGETTVWNNWRKEYPEIMPDLSQADLSRINFMPPFTKEFTLVSEIDHKNLYKDLSSVNFTEANLEGLYLSAHNNCSGSIFIRANLKAINLMGASLMGADFTHANLGGGQT